MLSEATSYCPAWLENSWLILSRTSFSGSTVKFTRMPVDLVGEHEERAPDAPPAEQLEQPGRDVGVGAVVEREGRVWKLR